MKRKLALTNFSRVSALPFHASPRRERRGGPARPLVGARGGRLKPSQLDGSSPPSSTSSGLRPPSLLFLAPWGVRRAWACWAGMLELELASAVVKDCGAESHRSEPDPG
jgi:hypothetical protein